MLVKILHWLLLGTICRLSALVGNSKEIPCLCHKVSVKRTRTQEFLLLKIYNFRSPSRKPQIQRPTNQAPLNNIATLNKALNEFSARPVMQSWGLIHSLTLSERCYATFPCPRTSSCPIKITGTLQMIFVVFSSFFCIDLLLLLLHWKDSMGSIGVLAWFPLHALIF